MDVNPIVWQYVIPAIMAAAAASMVGVVPYFLTRRETSREKAEADKTAVETSRIMYDGLSQRVAQLEAENENLRKQHDMLRKQNAYTVDLEATKYELEAQVHELNGRISTLERSLQVVIAAFREYIESPEEDVGKMKKILEEIEGQTSL